MTIYKELEDLQKAGKQSHSNSRLSEVHLGYVWGKGHWAWGNITLIQLKWSVIDLLNLNVRGL